jgi:predicted DNA-binding transcriptional regulator AlpA
MTSRAFDPAQRPTSKTAAHITTMMRIRPVTKLHTVDESAELSQLSEGASMTQQNIPTSNTGTGFERLLTARDAANLLRLSVSWLAKARMRGDGPPYVKLNRAIRYTETGILHWMRSRQRFSTSER